MDLLFFYSSFCLIFPLVSPSNPNPLLSNPNPYCSSTSTLTLPIESGIELDNELDAKDTFFSEIKSPNEVGISPSSAFDERFKDSRYAFSVTKVGIFPLSLLAGFGSDGGGWVRLGVMSVWVGDEDGGFRVWVDLDYEGFGFRSGCGWGCGGGGFVGVCCWGGGGGGASDLVLVGYGFVLICVLGCGWRWWLCGCGYWLLAVVWWLLIVFDEL